MNALFLQTLFIAAQTTAPVAAPAAEAAAAQAPAVEATAPVVEAAPEVQAPQNVPRALVLNLQDQGAGEAVLRQINDKMGLAALRFFKGSVVTSMQLAADADAAAKEMMEGCAESQCMFDLSKKVAATRVVGGTVSKVGESLLITIMTAEPGTGNDVKQIQKKIANERQVIDYTVNQLASMLFVGEAAPGDVPVSFRANVEGADVLIDEVKVGQTPVTVMVTPGEHIFKIDAGGREPWVSTSTVEAGAPLLLEGQLESVSFPLWPVTATAAGVSAVGIGVFAVAGIIAQNNYDGSRLGDPDSSYKGIENVDQITLSEKQATIENQALVANIGLVVGIVGAATAIGVYVTDLVINNE